MVKRANHYDAAFEAFLRARGTPYVAIDEHRRSLLGNASLKSMDFIVAAPRHQNLLVDVKGRRFPSGERAGHQWENWATQDDIESLLRWQDVFGSGFRAVLLFAYDIVDPRFLRKFAAVFDYAGRQYSFFGVWADQYQTAMCTRSARWETVSLRSRRYQDLRIPVEELLAC